MSVYTDILKKYWGYSEFRPLQEDIIRSVVAGDDTLALMPTGGGKSITFQVPALALEGTCIVVSPLIALMKDQVDRLNNLGIRAMLIHSGMTYEEIDISLDNCIYGGYKLLYVSPERLSTELFQARLQLMKVSLVAIDEAHCISQWGYDFRPSYLKIAQLREILPADVPFLALTASATPEVANDIMARLRFKRKNVLMMSFARNNITYLVRKVDDKAEYLVRTLRKMRGTGIIYTRSRKRSHELSDMLVANGISANYYHAGLNQPTRNERQQAWSEGKTRVMVCTNAFGMGIDKSDVRFVIHWEMPSSIEEYYQESGRAGRDGSQSYAVLLYSSADSRNLLNSLEKKFPSRQRIKDIYEALCNYLRIPIGGGKGLVCDFNMVDFVKNYKLPYSEAYNSLMIIQKEGYMEFTDEINNPSRVLFLVQRNDLYSFQVANEQFDSFIKLLLRSYTGLFTEYAAINEDDLARRSALSREQVYQYLVKLSSLRIINYIPRKKTALAIFTEERLARNNILISDENYIKVKEREALRIEKMIDYATIDTRCRQVMLLDYFGEISKKCGICDVCRQTKGDNISADEYERISKAIIELTEQQHGISAVDIVEQLPFSRERSVEVLRHLKDEGVIK